MVKSCPVLARFFQLSLLNAKLQWAEIEAVVAVASEVGTVEVLTVEALTVVEEVAAAVVVEVALMAAEIVAVLDDRATGGMISIYLLINVKVN